MCGLQNSNQITAGNWILLEDARPHPQTPNTSEAYNLPALGFLKLRIELKPLEFKPTFCLFSPPSPRRDGISHIWQRLGPIHSRALGGSVLLSSRKAYQEPSHYLLGDKLFWFLSPSQAAQVKRSAQAWGSRMLRK